ncbi:MAG: hypothetical protein H6835_02710 [Planctomycetes bacterium]|nr:hypothetical protein [Planctomycetota bacterium]
MFDAPVVEAVLWGLAGAGAVWRARAAAPGSRRVFTLVAVCVTVFVIDKVWDVYSALHGVGRWLATTIDPVDQLRGPHAAYRNAALAAIGLTGLVALWWWLRRERRLDRGRWLCVCGIGVVAALVVARLVPELQERLAGLPLKAAELLAWLLVVAGLLQRERGASSPTLRDGFVSGR